MATVTRWPGSLPRMVRRMKHTIQEWMNGKLQPVKYKTLLEALEDQRVMTVEAKDGGFEIGEACDNYFSVRVTPEQLRALGEELIALAHTPNDALCRPDGSEDGAQNKS